MLRADEKMEVAKNLSEKTFAKGDAIEVEGKVGTAFYILTEGDSARMCSRDINHLLPGQAIWQNRNQELPHPVTPITLPIPCPPARCDVVGTPTEKWRP